MRRKIDEAISQALDLPSLHDLASWLAMEPVISGRKIGAVSSEPTGEENEPVNDIEIKN